MGTRSARHRLKTIVAWLVFVVAAYAVGTLFGQQGLTDAQEVNGQSGTAVRALEKAFSFQTV
jgi:hypothetical protein